MNVPHFLSLGHITLDLVGNGITPGGPASFSTCTARSVEVSCGMVTSFSHPLLHASLYQGIELCCIESPHTTTFANLYDEHGTRRQIIEKVAATITPEAVPESWRSARIVNLCPVADEYLPDIIHLFPDSLVGVCPQGWMRKWGADGHVQRKEWETCQDVLPYADVVFFSEYDVAWPDRTTREYLNHVKMVVVTRGEHGSSVYEQNGNVWHVPGFHADEIDPTGAGDVFAASFLVKYEETRDPVQAATFANCVASHVVEKEGVYGIPLREDVEYRLRHGRRQPPFCPAR